MDVEGAPLSNKITYRLTLLTLFWCFFTYGLSDGSIGPLLPAYQHYYEVSLVRSSLEGNTYLQSDRLCYSLSHFHIQLHREHLDVRSHSR
jgi:hypothetical protein